MRALLATFGAFSVALSAVGNARPAPSPIAVAEKSGNAMKSAVTGNYVRDGQFLVELVWCVDTIEGDIFDEGVATVRLPSSKVWKTL